VFWKFNRGIAVALVDLRVRALEVGGQEILTKDKVALRINLTANYQFTDALQAAKAAQDPLDFLYKELQFGLRAAVGTRTLDALLEDKGAVDQEVFADVHDKFAEIGIEVRGIGVKDMAEKAAQANVIRRREETNATRSLLNTAKVMEDNPTALRLKELETLEKVTEKVGNISVYGGLDGVLEQMVRIKR
jgi:regulator of protease activity HflC (stomatin/prohibitin superfamily)